MNAGSPGRSEADDATRGSAIRLAAEVASRLLLYATSVLLARGLGPSDYGAFNKLSLYALLLAELGELGLQVLASRVLVSGGPSLGSLARARLVLALLVAALAAAAIPALPWLQRLAGDVASPGAGVLLALLIAWLALSGWGEFLGVALRCRGARRHEALLLLALRAASLALAGLALAASAGLRGVALGLALSPLPALALGAWLLTRTRAAVAGTAASPLAVLRLSAPLAVYAALLLLSPRVEFLVLSLVRDDRELGLFAAALSVVWFLAAVPGAITAGAMPALAREAFGGDDVVRRRTASTLAALAAPAAVGLALVAPHVAGLLFGGGLSAADTAGTTAPLRLMAAAVPALFLNALVAASLNAAGRAGWLPRLIVGRVVIAFVLATALVPRLAGVGAAIGLVCAEWALLAAGALACRRAGFPVPVARPILAGLVACVPMAFAVNGVAADLPLALAVGGLSWAATLAAAAGLAPALVRRFTGDLRYPWAP